jgi:hypothetical protein
MSNSIALAKKYVPLLDEVYKLGALTALLESDASMTREGANAGEIQVPTLTLQGLADYSRSTGYVAGDATLAWASLAFNYERGRKFSIDTMDDEETAGVAFGKLAGEFMRTKVIPEIDAFRFSQYAQVSGATLVEASLNSSTVVPALDAAINVMDDNEVRTEDRVCYMTPTIYSAVKNSNAATRLIQAPEGIDRRFPSFDGMPVVKVPQSRFYTSVDLTASGAGGFAKSSGGKDINFGIFSKSALLQFTKHAAPKIVNPQENQDADAWIFGYRIYGMAKAFANKAKGIYVHHKAS